MEQRLKEISLHLLDLGKRNRLINYKQTGLRTIDIINSDSNLLFNKLTSGQTLNIFNLDNILERYNKDIDGTGEEISEYSFLKVRDITTPLLKPNDVLCYKKGVKLSKILKCLYKEYKLTLLEKGINTLYVTFGLVEYQEKDEHYLAPLFLVPVDLFLENNKYHLKEYEDDVILNPTLLYLLKNEYNIDIEEAFKNFDLMARFNSLKIKLVAQNLVLHDRLTLGIYSFLKMNMYNDLNNNSAIVLQNKNIIRLLGGMVEQDELKEQKIHLVVDADSSQVEAVKYSSSGASFVLQGPPGSGKSQTITNIIATAIGNGKKVLFVSEKQAALNIVYENLKRAGLESFALELHSHKANKKEFIAELYNTAILPKYDINNDAYNIEQKHHYLETKLNSYRKVLHSNIGRLNKTLYELYGDYLSLPQTNLTYRFNNIKNLDYQFLIKAKELLNQYANLSKLLDYDYHQDVFYGFIARDLDYIRYQARTDLAALLALFNKANCFKLKVEASLPFKLVSYQDIIGAIEILNAFVNIHSFQEDYFICEKRQYLQNQLENYFINKEFIAKSTINKFFDLAILDTDITDLYSQFKVLSAGFTKYFKINYYRTKKQLKKYLKIQMNDHDLLVKLKELCVYEQHLKDMTYAKDNLPKAKDYEYELMAEDLKSLSCFNFDLKLDKGKYLELKNIFLDILINFQLNTLSNLGDYQKYFDISVINLVQGDLEKNLQHLEEICQKQNLLEIHAKRLALLDNLADLNLISYLDKALYAKLELDSLALDFEAQFIKANIYYEFDQNPILKEFTELSVDSFITEFKKLDVLHLETSKAFIVSKLSKLRPDDSILAGSKFAVLIKEYNKSRRQKPIRMLLAEIFELVLDLKPVFLMSPLSVSTYLNPINEMFDLVIFDEASQVFAWDALGAIYRAKQCIIIGDSKQMPPSNFFNNILENNEEDNFENDLESILDKGSSVFTTKQLNWHYRSRSEELIAFSNREFYNSRLITIPQAMAHKRFFGIDFHYIENGQYDAQTRTNLMEAKYIVDLIFKHFKELPNQSLGVVAFSSSQADLIADLVEEKRQMLKEFEEYFNEDKDEPFFVKNLESVQGDERDAIIFSICYGYNKDGKFYQHFGPLNNLGGERRLNVAITRAKYNVCIVSSIRSNDIRIENTESVGVKLLKSYLDYAENITTPKKVILETKDGIINAVKSFLEEQGFLVETCIGTSAFKIDLAVLHPLTKEYVVAIMLDGNSYQIGNITDVNRLQELLLNRLGWQFYRLFSTLWINSFQLEAARLLEFINAAFAKALPKSKGIEIESYLIEDHFEFADSFDKYKLVSDDEIRRLYNQKTPTEIIQYIVEKEEPIHIEFLLKRICFMYGRTKVTNIVRDYFLKDLSELDLINKDGFLMVHHLTESAFRVGSERSIEHIYPQELVDAIYRVVKKSNGIAKDGCFKAIIKLLGYTRMSENTLNYLNDALVFLKLEGKIVEKSDCLYI